MLKSMTGYGRAEVKDKKYGKIFVEIQGVNRKYCDISINLPKHLLALEQKIREVVSSRITRGKINVFVGQSNQDRPNKLYINMDLAKEYYLALKKVKKDFKLKGDLDISLLSGLKDFIVQAEPEVNLTKMWNVIERALGGAIGHFQSMREKEGIAASRHIEEILKDIEDRVKDIESMVPRLAESFKQKLENKLKEFGLTVSHTDERVQKEVAIISERTDISEEVNRMRSHISQFRSLMKKEEPVGRTIDFLIQEMMREANTMGSKAVQTEISTHIIHIKSQIEKIREQIQNVE